MADLYSIWESLLLMASSSSDALSSRVRASDSSYDFLASIGLSQEEVRIAQGIQYLSTDPACKTGSSARG